MFGFKLDPLRKIKRGHLWHFHGGIHPNENKNTCSLAITAMPLPNVLVVPVKQHSGNAGEIIVKEGQSVKKGQPLTMCISGRDLAVHAPTSGTVKNIQYYNACHPSGFKDLAVVIEPDGKDEWCELRKTEDFRSLEPEELIKKIRDAGIVGMGGAGFPAHAKISSAKGKVKVLIINGCECEPYLTCDDRLMQEKTEEIVTGIEILQYILKPEIVIIAIENNKPQAIKAMKAAVRDRKDIKVRVLPTLYPSGAARPLIRILTGHEVGYTHRSTDFGVMMQNVTSSYYIKRAIVDGEPSIERIVTITGNNFKEHANVIVRNGTLLRQIVNKYKLNRTENARIIIGGPMMGFTVGSLSVPMTKTVNCIIAPDELELPCGIESLNCIKCGKCQHACPSHLTPYKMYGHIRSSNWEQFEKCNPKDCIECGCCAYVCPSKIDLVNYFRIGKAQLNKQRADKKRREQIKYDTNFKLEQIKFEQESRAAKLEELKKKTSDSENQNNVAKQKVQEALLRAKKLKEQKAAEQKQNAVSEGDSIVHNSAADPKEIARKKALAIAQAKAKANKEEIDKSADENSSSVAQENMPATSEDPKDIARKKALALAQAKAKAKKAETEKAETENISSAASETQTDAAEDPKDIARKKALALALAQAKAKAKKAEMEKAETENSSSAAQESQTDAAEDPKDIARKKALALAQAKAKAKKAEMEKAETKNSSSAAQESQTDAAEDPKDIARKKALALAKAKAKKAEMEKAETENSSSAAQESQTDAAENPKDIARKKALALALARKKQMDKEKD